MIAMKYNNQFFNIEFYLKYKCNIIQRIIFGIFMGFSDTIPGYSGGTTLNLLNFYEIFVLRLKLVFKKSYFFSDWFKNILWLLPFVLFWMLSLFAFSHLTETIAKSNYDLALIFLFFSFSLFCIPIFVFEQKRKLLAIDKNAASGNSSFKFMVLLGLMLFVAISVGVYLNGGISLKPTPASDANLIPQERWLLLTVISFVSTFVMLIPGISGQLILYLTNTYQDYSWIMLQNPIDNMAIISITFLSASAGFISCIFLVNYLMKNHAKYFIPFTIGLVMGSPIAILLGMLGNQVYINELNNLGTNAGLLVAIIFAIIFGFLFNVGLFLYIFISRFYQKYNKHFDDMCFLFCDNNFIWSDDNVIKKMVYLLVAKIYKIDVMYHDDDLYSNDKPLILTCHSKYYKLTFKHIFIDKRIINL